MIERFCSVGLKGLRSQGHYRTCLRSIGPKLTKKAPWLPRPKSMTRRKVARPYSGQDLVAVRDDARQQSTPRRRRAGLALVHLGAGAGLDGRWSVKVRGTDIEKTVGAVLVRVGPPSPRAVPVRMDYEQELLELAEEAGDEFLVGGRSHSRNRASDLVAHFEIGHGHPRLSASRLRATWLVHHLTIGTRIPELAAAAGLQGIGVLSDLMEFVPLLPEEEAQRMLRGAQ